MQSIQIKFAFTILLHTILESQNIAVGQKIYKKGLGQIFFRYISFADFFKKEKKIIDKI